MSQHDMNVANADGATVRADINAALVALVGQSSGTTAPATTFPYQFWADTTANLLKMRNGANSAWITVGDLTAANLGLLTSSSLGTLRGYISGLTLSNDVATPNTIIDIADGICSSSDSTSMMTLPGMTKNCNAAWAVGSGNGALDSGSSLSPGTWYHVYAIQRLDTGVVDTIVSTSPSSPSLPANYTKKRRIGSFLTDGSSHIIPFTQLGDEFTWTTPRNDVGVSTLSTTPTLFALSTPLGVQTFARMRGYMSHASAGINILITSPNEAPAASNSPAGNLTCINSIAAIGEPVGELRLMTDTSSQVRAVSSAASTSLSLSIFGWTDDRGRNA